jgi:bacterioferritin-associated ferredoxin
MADETQEEKERKIKQLHMVVCICKGINLGRVLKGLEGSSTVEDVNRKVGTGSGGCKGERCGPRIRLLLKKYADLKS